MFNKVLIACTVMICLFVPVLASHALAQDAASNLIQSGEQIRIKADQLEVDDKANTVTFTGKVNAVQGKAVLTCDKMIIHYTKKSDDPTKAAKGGREIQKIHVIGHVKVVQEDKTATGRQGLYELAGKRVELWGDPKIIQGGNTLTGQKVIVYLNESRAVVQGGRNQVEAVIVPQQASQETEKEEAKLAAEKEKKSGGKAGKSAPAKPAPSSEKNTAKSKAGLKQKAMED